MRCRCECAKCAPLNRPASNRTGNAWYDRHGIDHPECCGHEAVELDNYELIEGTIVRDLLVELGYAFTLEEACAFWGDLSDETHSANWLSVTDRSNDWRARTKTSIKRYIRGKRADAVAMLTRFPGDPKP